MNRRITGRPRTAARLSCRFAIVFAVIGVAQVGPRATPSASAVQEKLSDLGPQMGALLAGETVQVNVGIDAEMVGFSWDADLPAELEVRGAVGGGWTEWLHIDGGPADEVDPVPVATEESAQPTAEQTTAGPAWLARDVRTVEMRLLDGTPSNMVLHALDTDRERSGFAQFGPAAASAEVASPFISSRAAWGADESWRTINADCTGPSYSASVRMAVIHHTAGSNAYGPDDSAALVRGIYYFHTHTNGWCDIGYNFLVDRFGRIFEGRAGGIALPVIGAHAGGFNSYSTGVSVLGDFTSVSPSAAARDAVAHLIAWKFSLHRVKGASLTYTVNESPCVCQRWPAETRVTLPTITTHRDLDHTDCPGDGLYGWLGSIRSSVASIVAAAPGPPSIYLSRSNQQVRVDIALTYGDAGDIPLMCDFDGDGVDTPVIFRNGFWFVRNANASGVADSAFVYGGPGDVPVCGRWRGGGRDGPGVFRNGQFYLRMSPTTGVAELHMAYGDPFDMPVVGDWNRDGTDTVGVFRGGFWFLKQTNGGSGSADLIVVFGDPDDLPAPGDWNGDGLDSLGVYRYGRWYLRGSVSTGVADAGVFQFGAAWDRPLPADIGPGAVDSPGTAVNY